MSIPIEIRFQKYGLPFEKNRTSVVENAHPIFSRSARKKSVLTHFHLAESVRVFSSFPSTFIAGSKEFGSDLMRSYYPRLQAAIRCDRRLESRVETTRRWIPRGRIHCKLDGNSAGAWRRSLGPELKFSKNYHVTMATSTVKRHYRYVSYNIIIIILSTTTPTSGSIPDDLLQADAKVNYTRERRACQQNREALHSPKLKSILDCC